jgi:1,2-diacylglycerol 3-beta-glucosyltransferase
MHLIDLLISILLFPVTIAVIYLYFLAVVGVTQKKQYPEISKNYDFLILVPAHNEEQNIVKTLQSLIRLDPIGKIDIVVIADNCNDKTADIVRANNIKVIERFNENQKGKGYALHWAISQTKLSNYNAVVIVDADTIVNQNMLQAMAQSFENGASAVQVYNSFLIMQKTHLSYLQLMANIAENIFFYKARSILNLPILLRGTGMAIDSKVLQEHPWNSFSITEDVDYAVNILKHNIKIDFNINSAVYSGATSSYQQSASQKIRWAGGTAKIIKEKILGLLLLGIKKRNPTLVELGFSFFLLSRPLLIYITLPILLLSFLSVSSFQMTFTLWCLALIGMLILYNILGIFFVKDKFSALKALLFIPFYGMWFFYIQISAIIKSKKLSWNKTERNNSE